ncbi:atypical/PIKK/TRRAP protein kinase [Coprinopsis cinerea AmutBmut pab1-1]|nr:atypical/PIKK/TRRAP protein kinase [Coprinopsis cinerea AmutBmut pab1-1]
MSTNTASEAGPSSGSSDFENRVARIADPNTDLKTKHAVALEIKELIDTTRDSEFGRVLPYLVPTLIDLLRSGQPSFQRDTTEYQFRRLLLDILNRIPSGEAIRPHMPSVFQCMIAIVRQDNEENGATACKTMVDVVRSYRIVTEQGLADFIALFQESFANIKGMVEEYLSEDSTQLDPNTILPATRSLKVLGEMGMIMIIMSQVQRAMVSPSIQGTIAPAFEMLAQESSAQHKARTDFEAMGGIWAGMAPTIKNPTIYNDLIQAQIKMLSYLAFVMRYLNETEASYGETLVSSALRILQDCPSNGNTLRKELMVVFRHLLATPHRRALLGHIDKLLDEKVLLGTGLASKDSLRPMVYSAVADLIHNVKSDLTFPQIVRIVHVYSALLFNTSLGFNLHILFAKVIFGLTDAIVAKEVPQTAAKLLSSMLETCLERLEGLCTVQADVSQALERIRSGSQEVTVDTLFIEKSRPVGGALYALEKPEDVMLECRQLYRALLHGLRVTIVCMKKCDAPVPDGKLVFRLFEGCVRCMSLYDADPRVNEQNDVIDWFGHTLLELNLHVFQEVWTHKMGFFFEHAQKRIVLLTVCQFLFNRESTTSILLGIVLKYLVGRLPLLGEYDDITAAATIRLFKMAFNAVTTYPHTNESILASHLPKLLMDCFPLAAKASKPTHYFYLLRALFRAIGVGGGRFELLYSAVLPLLPELLESLNRQLLASEGQTRDMIVELCLTVPLRLTHLLPHLSYLMQPLALALRGGFELASQGLRTLELCIDNLTPDFLDPTLSVVLRELMEALFSHLKPAPQSHHLAHTTIRILGKLGGRNRRLLFKEPALIYHHPSEPAKMVISFNGNEEKILLGPICKLAITTLAKSPPADQMHAYSFLENCASLFLYEGIKGRNVEDFFVRTVEGIFDSIYIPTIQNEAESYLRKLASTVFENEIRRNQSREVGARPTPSPVLNSFLEAIPHGLAREQPAQCERAKEVVAILINDLIEMRTRPNIGLQGIFPLLHSLANRFTGLCLDESWIRKAAGCNGIKLMLNAPVVAQKWVSDREIELVRNLMHALKDLPYDLPRDVEDVIETLLDVLRLSNSSLDFTGDGAAHARNKIVHLAGMFFPEFQSSNRIIRDAAQRCINYMVTLSGRTPGELFLPHRERMLAGVYTKPLRALPFLKQIGIMESMRYCLKLEPQVIDASEELLRLLHEALALADAEDVQLVGPRTTRSSALEILKLRESCIKLLTAAMPITDFFGKIPHTRQRVTSVYFKSLYSPSAEVKEAAHTGLRMVLAHQNRLPKELLQSGLRPILMNLADPKRLTVSGLEGLARVLSLLNNYFKVEIGHKLLEHFRVVADPQSLQATARLPFSETEGVPKLVRLANIFHLLPSAANVFLDPLVNLIIQTETQMHFSTVNPFSEPLAKYLDRYPVEGIDFLVRNLQLPRTVRTFRSALQAKVSPNLERELVSRTPILAPRLSGGADQNQMRAILEIIDDLITLEPTFLSQHAYVTDQLVAVWRSLGLTPNDGNDKAEITYWHSIIQSSFIKAMKQTPRIDLLFELIAIYSRNLEIDTVKTTTFLYQHVALSEDIIFRRNVLMRFLTWFNDSSVPLDTKGYFIRYVVTPTLLVQANRSPTSDRLINLDFISQLHRIIWSPITENDAFLGSEEYFKIEILNLTTVLVQYYSDLLDDVKKDIIRCAWAPIQNNDDVLIRQMAFLLLARFFSVFPSPPKFVLRAWTDLLRLPHSEGRASVRYEALSILAPSLPKSDGDDPEFPQWAKATRRLLTEEGAGQAFAIYHLIVKQPDLFYPVRSLFVPHMTNSLNKLGMSPSSTTESRHLSLDILQTVFNWEEQAARQAQDAGENKGGIWRTPLSLRENMVSYLMRLATIAHDQPTRGIYVSRALGLLQNIVGPSGWTDVTVGLRFFSRALEQTELSDATLLQALSAAKVLHVVSKEQPDSWYLSNAVLLEKLVQKGLLYDDANLQDALYPIFDKLVTLFPLPEAAPSAGDTEHAAFHQYIHDALGENLLNSPSLRGSLLMLKSVISVTPERLNTLSTPLMKLLSKLAKDHIHSTPNTPAFDSNVRLITAILDISRNNVTFLGEQRRWLLTALVILIEKSKSIPLCKYILELSRTWAMNRQDPYPTAKEKASLLQKMAHFEGRGEPLFTSYLELIYDVYTEPALRRSDLTTRLENSFLIGCRARDTALRERFMDLLDVSVSRSVFNRLTYVLGVQNWEALADHNWIYLALHLILGAVDLQHSSAYDRRLSANTTQQIQRPLVQNIVRPMQRLLFLDPQVAHDTWVSVFPAVWSSLSRREQADITNHMINLLSKDYHIKQSSLRPNVVQSLLAGIHRCSPPMTLPPHLVKYLAKTFGCWHIGLEILGDALDYLKDDDPALRDYVYDSLAEIYAELAEEDMFYGLWRRRSVIPDTNVGLAFEQVGMWEQASSVYEAAQTKVKAGNLPFNELEYCLWEDHWVLATEKLQHWDILYDFAKSEGNQELMLESAWRTLEWAGHKEELDEQIAQLPDVATPRRRVFEAFIALLKQPAAIDKNVDFTRFLEDAMQLSLRKWVGLPQHFSVAHIPLLQHFQQFVELQEAVQIFGSLSQTNAQNLEKKSSELKMVLQAWRERLPNVYDDINIWSDLVAWRQNVFHSINLAYVPLIENLAQSAPGGNQNTNTYGYRGYHETAWIINRFAHVARKHGLLDVCFTYLNKIYTLPNIEISEAFLKLREQARCHYQKPSDLQIGLEVINNTNLMFFTAAQKAEFHTLKGMFYARLGRLDEASAAFGQAVQLDMTQAKVWAEWGRYNDQRFKENPADLTLAASAVSCYLQAAGLYKCGKSRPLLMRVLYLLSLDNDALIIGRSFDGYKGDAAFWYWIALVPQLCVSLSHKENKPARYILLNLAKHFPQGIFYHLRTTREELQVVKKAIAAKAAQQQALEASRRASVDASGDVAMADGTGTPSTEGNPPPAQTPAISTPAQPQAQPQNPPQPRASPAPPAVGGSEATRAAWEYVDEILQILKTAFPLLILSLETVVDQIQHKFKPQPEEEVYRNVCMLMQDAIQNYVLRANAQEDDGQLTPNTVAMLSRMAVNMPNFIRKDYEEDFITSKPDYSQYMQRLRQWRDRFEKTLDARPQHQPLALLSHYLTEFQYSKVDEIEVPGQYTEDKDSNQSFVRIQKFAPKFETVRSNGAYWKRFTLIGNDHSKTSFIVQLPCHRQWRREERVIQLLRTLNCTLVRKKESRRRNLAFHLPAVVSLSPAVRLFQTDSSYISFGDIYDLHCEEKGIAKEMPILYSGEKVKQVLRQWQMVPNKILSKTEYITLKKDIFDEIASKMVPDTVISNYMVRTMDGPVELWRMRKQFTLQLATCSFMTYVFSISSRNPSRYQVSRATGLIAMTDLLPGLATHLPVFATTDTVPFRFTPNLQHFVGPVFTDGILATGIMSVGQALTEPEFDLEYHLCLFSRDEVGAWMGMRGKPFNIDQIFRQSMIANMDNVVKKAEAMACKLERENSQQPNVVPNNVVYQTVINQISTATNPISLAKMGELYQPWF